MIDFNRMIDNFLKREHRPKSIGKYYPSEIGSCIRRVWYSYKFPMEMEPKLIRIFEVGNLMHDFVVNVLKSEKNNNEIELLKSEFPFREIIDDFEISGRIDNLIMVKASGKQVLVEVKSTKDVEHINEAMPHNVSQLQLYMHYLKIHDGILLYVNKNDLTAKAFDVEYSSEDAEKIIARFGSLNKMLKNDIIPKPESRESQKTIWMCRFCEYRNRCYDETPSSTEFL